MEAPCCAARGRMQHIHHIQQSCDGVGVGNGAELEYVGSGAELEYVRGGHEEGHRPVRFFSVGAVSSMAAAATAGGACGDGDGGRRLRVFFVPFFARGHLIPMTDLACLMAAASPDGVDVEATMVVTPANAASITATVAGNAAVRVVCYPFPDIGLARGVECLGAATTHDAWRVYRAVDLSRPVHESLL
uniref:Uncharacterized protein n=1 Tax=Oryza punctata TaxID=4537 RepID=A0A0E0L1Y2_ORYPU